MKCGFGAFTHSKPAGKKKKGKDLLFMKPIGNVSSPVRKAYGSGNVYSENRGNPEKIRAVFLILYLS